MHGLFERFPARVRYRNVEPVAKALCCCQKNQSNLNASADRSLKEEVGTESAERGSSVLNSEEKSEEEETTAVVELRTEEEEKGSTSVVSVRRSNSSDSCVAAAHATGPGPRRKRFGSLEFLATSERFNRAKVTELNDEEDEEVSEIHESVFVDIPTLVAVLIKPDNNLQGSSVQIEEICSDEVVEESIVDAEFEPANDHEEEAFDESEKLDSVDHDDRSSSVNSCHAFGENEASSLEVCQSSEYPRVRSTNTSEPPTRRSKFRKQDTVDVLPSSVLSNLHALKKFGSVEAIQKKKDPVFSLERSHTNLENRSNSIADRAKKLKNIREIDDHQKIVSNRSGWPKERKDSNDSDKSLKESGSKARSYARKPSLDSLKRKTSKDSSSSSSKDEQILISSLARDKLLRRKSSLEQEPSTRSHTPIQRTKRAEIVAAVTERLYSSRKHLDDVSGVRSPPDTGCEAAKSAAKLKLQEISRKMLGKRKRVCVDTQTECSRTLRMKDAASLTETPQITRQDVGVLTDHHEACEYALNVRKIPILRVKEMATLTEKPRTIVVKCRDVASLANDLEDYDYEIHSPRNDSGILSDDTRNYTDSNLSSTEVSDLGQDRRVVYAESSTNTSTFSSCRNFAVQTSRRPSPENEATASCARQCCSPRVKDSPNRDRSVISISLPDTISITIETTSTVDSRIVAATTQVDNDLSLQSKDAKRGGTKEEGAQTDEWNDPRNEIYCSRDQAASAPSQTDGRVFRIENIFHDPNNAAKNSRVDSNRTEEGTRIRNSITFRNSLGTSYVSQPKRYELPHEGLHAGGFIRNGLITEAFINRKRSFNSRRAPSTAVYQNPWRNWQVPASSTMANNFSKGLGVVVPAAWRPEVEGTPFERGNYVAGESPADFQLDSIDEISRTKSSYSGSLNNNAADHEHGFSDDSLDYNEINASDETLKAKPTTEQREKNLCPPDVVAHTKKDCPKTVDSEKNESVNDFEDGRVAEFPKRKLIESTDASNARDYKSLILGKACYSYEEINDESNICPSRADGPEKKKVSFSSHGILERKSSPESPATLKPIIKNRRSKNVLETASSILSFNEDETDGFRQEERTDLTENADWNGEVRSASWEDGNEGEHFARNSKQCRGKVKFSVEESLENTSCSESDSYENVEDEEVEEGEDEEVLLDRAGRNVLEDYLSEAVTFMRNLNSISEYANRSMLKRNPLSWTSLVRGRDGKRGARRRDCSPSSWDRDYSEFVSRKVSSKKVDDDYPEEEQKEEEEEDITISTDSYERCLKGIQRLEDCIRRVDRHNELLREKYGVNCESAGARLDLASPSTEARASPTTDDSEILREAEIPLFQDSGVVERKEDDDVEKKIFDQLMNVANSIRYGKSNMLRSRGSLLATPEPRSRSPGTKFRDKYRCATKEPPFCGDVRGNLSVEEASDDRRDLTTYEITGNLSVERTCSTERKNDDLKPALEEGFSPLRKFNRTSWPTDSNCPASMMCSDEHSFLSRYKLTDTTDSFGKMYSTARGSLPNARTKRFQETDDYSRRAREAGRRVCACWKDHADIESTAGEITHLRDKLKYPGSPRARFLELLRERRRIVECSRGTSAS
ncbi:hypothetical protein K0M31_015011 [Melipona bicolor]|uniref:Uncharacterized protein n=1 Tax=Melipona bicolor TaxID=60889 RepID=A0AA40FFY2_9HYME|nr:hypothetical protein K0M31_015011 [Melipona bicolor]